jgi:nanoRNase/pAp phosphatase (c-di-AMP/oligoRNAs hydrolase)
MGEPQKSTETSDRLLDVLGDYRRFLIVTHDIPDPDAIAAGWAVHELIRQRLVLPVQLVGGGGIVRAENRHMLKLLRPPLRLTDALEVTDDTGTILVDCGFGSANQLLTRHAIRPVAVIDHHPDHSIRPATVPFCDVRPEAAASATIAASYLLEQGIEPGPKLATAVLYAMRTETCGEALQYSALDRSILVWLTERADPALLAEIECAPLEPEYFADMALAIQNTFLYDDAALCFLPRAAGPEIVGEVADLLIRCRGVRRVLCGAAVDDDLYLSARTETGAGDAADLLRATVGPLGSGGGHAHRAGGKISGAGSAPGVSESLQREIRTRWLAACAIDQQPGRRLVPKRDIVKNL